MPLLKVLKPFIDGTSEKTFGCWRFALIGRLKAQNFPTFLICFWVVVRSTVISTLCSCPKLLWYHKPKATGLTYHRLRSPSHTENSLCFPFSRLHQVFCHSERILINALMKCVNFLQSPEVKIITIKLH